MPGAELQDADRGADPDAARRRADPARAGDDRAESGRAGAHEAAFDPGGVCIAHVNLARGFRGGERQTELLVRELAARGWRQRLVARRGEPLAARLRDCAGLEVREAGGFAPAAALALGGLDLVHVHEARAAQAAWLADLATRTPYLITRRVDNRLRGGRTKRAMYRRAAAVVALSRAIREVIHGFEPALEVEIIPSAASGLAAEPAAAAAIRARYPYRFLIGHVGALDHRHKGQRTLIEAARGLAATSPELLFMLVGDGRDEARLRQASAGLDNVVFEGRVENVGDYLAAFDLFAFPSLHEGLGSILLDAMTFGLPIVASRVGGIPEAVPDGENAILVPPGDAAALAAAIAELHRDPARRERMAAANRARVERYTAESMADAYVAVYRRVLRGEESASARRRARGGPG